MVENQKLLLKNLKIFMFKQDPTLSSKVCLNFTTHIFERTTQKKMNYMEINLESKHLQRREIYSKKI